MLRIINRSPTLITVLFHSYYAAFPIHYRWYGIDYSWDQVQEKEIMLITVHLHCFGMIRQTRAHSNLATLFQIYWLPSATRWTSASLLFRHVLANTSHTCSTMSDEVKDVIHNWRMQPSTGCTFLPYSMCHELYHALELLQLYQCSFLNCELAHFASLVIRMSFL